MGFWAGIKYSLNSTLGTSEAKPLDEIIRGEKRMIASESEIAPACINNKFYSFTTKVDGVLLVKGVIRNKHYDIINFYINIYENNNILLSEVIPSIPVSSSVEFSLKFPIKKNMTYKIGSDSLSVANIENSYFCGQITDYNYFESSEV